MNPETGEIKFASTKEESDLMVKNGMVPVEFKAMTEKQKETKQVSIFDARSKLGVMFTEHRAEQRINTKFADKDAKASKSSLEEEYKKIQNKTSSLSRSDREAVKRLYEKK
jgi:hypothetical protein